MITAPRHPYTRMLIESLPGIDAKRRLTGIPCLPPRLIDMPPGCTFAPRYSLATNACSASVPALRSIGDGQVARHLHPGLTAQPKKVAPSPCH